MAADERDRQKELEHFESSRRKLIEEGNPDAEMVILQMEQAMQEHLQKRLNLDARSPADHRGTKSALTSREASPDSHSVSGFDEVPKVSSGGFKPVSPEVDSGANDSASLKDSNGSEIARKDSSTFLFSMSSSKSTWMFRSDQIPPFY